MATSKSNSSKSHIIPYIPFQLQQIQFQHWWLKPVALGIYAIVAYAHLV